MYKIYVNHPDDGTIMSTELPWKPELLAACENVAKDFGAERLDGCEGIFDKSQCDKSSCMDVDYCERREKLYSTLCAAIAKAKGEA